MDKKIKSVKRSTDKKFDQLLKADKKRDAKCEKAEMKAKSGKRK